MLKNTVIADDFTNVIISHYVLITLKKDYNHIVVHPKFNTLGIVVKRLFLFVTYYT